jgi:hypothetical protein
MDPVTADAAARVLVDGPNAAQVVTALLLVAVGLALLLALYTFVVAYVVGRLMILPPHYTPRTPAQGLPMAGT